MLLSPQTILEHKILFLRISKLLGVSPTLKRLLQAPFNIQSTSIDALETIYCNLHRPEYNTIKPQLERESKQHKPQAKEIIKMMIEGSAKENSKKVIDHHPLNINRTNSNNNAATARRSFRLRAVAASYSSVSSLSSHGSDGSGGGKMKARLLNSNKKPSFTKNSLLGRTRMSRVLTAPIIKPSPRRSSRRRVAGIKSCVDLLPAGQRRSSRSHHTANEEWDDAMIVKDTSNDAAAPPSFSSTTMAAYDARAFVTKWTSNISTSKNTNNTTANVNVPMIKKKKTKRVAFITKGEIIGTTSYATIPIESIWYTSPTCDTFLTNSLTTARSVRRLMMYASTLEPSYKSSTGLVSASSLSEFLSSPQEVLGIENHLSGQQSARVSLKSNHKRACLGEQRHLDLDGCTLHCDILASRLADYSNISAHMARERASYCLALED